MDQRVNRVLRDAQTILQRYQNIPEPPKTSWWQRIWADEEKPPKKAVNVISMEPWVQPLRAQLPHEALSLLLQIEVDISECHILPADNICHKELTKLLNEYLPSLVRKYVDIPVAARTRATSNGYTPISELLDGITTVQEEANRIVARWVQPEVEDLVVENRFLSAKFK